MPLYVDVIHGYPNTVETDLFHICQSDGGFGDTSVLGDITVLQITYSQGFSSFGANRLNQIVNSTTRPIVITGVDSSAYIQGFPITQIAGITYADSINPAIIRVVYDTSQCGGNGYCVYDTGGNPIPFPGSVLCFHELAHAFRVDRGMPFGEFEAITDENGLRNDNGLTNRDPGNHAGGCGCSPIDENCFIVSAVSGAESTTRTNRLRGLRDFCLRSSVLGVKFFDEFWDEYYQFSPKVASDIYKNPLTKTYTSVLCVEPLLNFMNLLEHYLSKGSQCIDIWEELEENVQSFLAKVSEAGLSPDIVESLPDTLTVVRNYLGNNNRGIETPHISTGDARVDSVLTYLTKEISSKLQDIRYMTWAVMDPVIYYWQLVNMLQDDDPVLRLHLVSLFEWVNCWLSEAPITLEFDSLDRKAIEESLVQLSTTVFVTPSLRRRYGERLLSLYRDKVPYRLEELLFEAGYMV